MNFYLDKDEAMDEARFQSLVSGAQHTVCEAHRKDDFTLGYTVYDHKLKAREISDIVRRIQRFKDGRYD